MENDEADESDWAAALAAAHARAADVEIEAESESPPKRPTKARTPTASPTRPAARDGRRPRCPRRARALIAESRRSSGDRRADRGRVAAEPAVAAQPPESIAPAALAELHALVELLRAGRCILCAGPRLGDTPLTIRDVLTRLVATLPSEDVREVLPVLQARPLAAAGFIARRLGEGFAPALAAALGHGAALPDVVELPRRAAVPRRGHLALRRLVRSRARA